jgi:hypothetical protein
MIEKTRDQHDIRPLADDLIGNARTTRLRIARRWRIVPGYGAHRAGELTRQSRRPQPASAIRPVRNPAACALLASAGAAAHEHLVAEARPSPRVRVTKASQGRGGIGLRPWPRRPERIHALTIASPTGTAARDEPVVCIGTAGRGHRSACPCLPREAGLPALAVRYPAYNGSRRA